MITFILIVGARPPRVRRDDPRPGARGPQRRQQRGRRADRRLRLPRLRLARRRRRRRRARVALASSRPRIGAWLSRRFGNRSEAEIAPPARRRRLVLDDARPRSSATGCSARSPSRSASCSSARSPGSSTVALRRSASSSRRSSAGTCPRSSSTARRSERHHEIDRELPELIDLLVVTVEAGHRLHRLAAARRRGARRPARRRSCG